MPRIAAETDLETARILFDGARLSQARELAGLRKVDVASGIGVSAAAVGQFETGAARPSGATLRRLAAVLDVPPAFFAGDRPRFVVTDTQAHFRSLRSTPQRVRARARAQVAILAEFVNAVQRFVELPDVDLPALAPSLPPGEAAVAVRDAWELGAQPVSNLVRLLENHGIVLARLPAATDEVDAFSCWIADRPYIVLVANKQAADRARFDAAHELAHLLLDQDGHAADPVAERRAHEFAAEFLAPQRALLPDLPPRVDWRQLAALKLKWGVSMAMLVRRMKDLNVITDAAYQRAMIDMSRQGWRRREPVEIGVPETPELLARAVRTTGRLGRASLGDLASAVALPVHTVERLIAPTTRDAREVVTV